MFSKDLEHSIGQCYKRARDARHEFMTVEHLLLALLDNNSAEAVLKAVGADFPRLRRELEEAIEVSVNKLADDDGRPPPRQLVAEHQPVEPHERRHQRPTR